MHVHDLVTIMNAGAVLNKTMKRQPDSIEKAATLMVYLQDVQTSVCSICKARVFLKMWMKDYVFSVKAASGGFHLAVPNWLSFT